MSADTLPADILAAALAVLRRRDPADWSIQGLGMLRAYLTADRVWRLHVWDSRAVYEPKPSRLHTHPWDFTSWTLAGRMRQVRYVEGAPGFRYQRMEIRCGAGGCALTTPERVRLTPGPTEVIPAGASYRMGRNEIHDTFPDDGTITVIRREFHDDTETARVYFTGARWVSAEPRPAPAGLLADVLGSLPEIAADGGAHVR